MRKNYPMFQARCNPTTLSFVARARRALTHIHLNPQHCPSNHLVREKKEKKEEIEETGRRETALPRGGDSKGKIVETNRDPRENVERRRGTPRHRALSHMYHITHTPTTSLWNLSRARNTPMHAHVHDECIEFQQTRMD